MTRVPRPARAAARAAGRAALAGGLLLVAAASGPARAGAATKLFITNHVNSNQVQGMTEWQGQLALATLGGIVFADPSTGALTKTLRSPGGLPSNRVLCVARSPSGSLWVGTADGGIARMRTDGSFRRPLTSFDGLPNDRVQSLYVSGDSVWVGTSAGVALFTEDPASGRVQLRRSDTSASTGGALVSDDVTALQQVGDTIWCATGAGLSSFAGGAWLNRASLLGVAARALALHQDTLWAATAAGPRRMSDGAFQIVATGYLGAGRALYSDGGDLYAGSTGGVFRYSGGAWVWTDGGLPSNTVHAVGGAGGRLWAGTEAGLARFDGGTPAWTAILSQGPAVNGSQRATTDSRGVWIVTGNFFAPATGAGAVLHFDGAAWTTITAVSTAGAFQAADAFAVLSDRAGTLWFGHCCSASDPKPRVDRWNPAADVWDRPATTNIYALALSPDGRVFAGSVEHGNGVYEFDPGTAALLDSLTPANTQGGIGPGLTSNNLRGIAFDARGRGWFATFNTGLDIWDERGTIGDHADDVWVHLGTGFPSVQTTAVVTDGPASGWVGTVAGVARVVNELVNPFVTTAVTAALPSPQVKDLALDSSGNLWVATAGGLARVEAGTAAVERFTADDGLAGNDVRALAWDPARGVLWAGTTEGVSEIHPGTSAGPAFGSDAYLYPNPVGAGSGALRVGGLTGEVHGEIRDLQGGVVRDFRCDPAQNVAWDLRLPDGTPAAAGVYLVVLRDGRQSRILRAAVVR